MRKISAADPKQIALDTAGWVKEHPVQTAVYGVSGVSILAPSIIAAPVLGLAGFGSAGVAGGKSISSNFLTVRVDATCSDVLI